MSNRKILNKECISYDDLIEYIDYNSVSGILSWKKKLPHTTIKPGDVISGTNSNGYIRVKFRQHEFKGHHVAWFITYKIWPLQLDHIDRNKVNNAIDNLRECTDEQNNQNRSVSQKSKTGVKGVCFFPNRPSNPYRAVIQVNNKKILIGRFKTLEEAKLAREKAEIHHFGQFASISIS